MADSTLFLNPDFMPSYIDKEYFTKHRMSGLAYDIHSLLRTIHRAADNDGSGIPFDESGIPTSIGMAVHMMENLIEQCETAEKSGPSRMVADLDK